MAISSNELYTKVMKNNKNWRKSIYDPMNARDVEQLSKIIIFRELDLFDVDDLVAIDKYDNGALLERFPTLENCFCLVRDGRLICVLGCYLIEDILGDYPEMVVNVFSARGLQDAEIADSALIWDKGMEFRAVNSNIQA